MVNSVSLFLLQVGPRSPPLCRPIKRRKEAPSRLEKNMKSSPPSLSLSTKNQDHPQQANVHARLKPSPEFYDSTLTLSSLPSLVPLVVASHFMPVCEIRIYYTYFPLCRERANHRRSKHSADGGGFSPLRTAVSAESPSKRRKGPSSLLRSLEKFYLSLYFQEREGAERKGAEGVRIV